MTVFRPTDAAEVREAVAWAMAGKQSLDISGGGSKRNLGRPASAAHSLDVGALSGVIDYDPAELVLTAKAATPMAQIQALLDAQRQTLAFEPPDWRALWGSNAEPTLGGIVACNMAGPRRVKAGSARDHFLGFSAVNGFGEAWKAGGRVVKNVTGYDMCKLQAGAFGTLSVLLELTLRVTPRPETSCTLVLRGLDDQAAIEALASALNAPHEVTAAAHLPAAAAGRSSIAGVAGSATIVRLEGHSPSVDYRAGALAATFSPAIRLDAALSARLWSEIGSVQPLLASRDAPLWRICCAPSAAPAVLAQIQSRLVATEAFYDWGGGLLWLSLDAAQVSVDCGAATIRAAFAATGGHATLIRAPDAVRAATPVFEPRYGGLEALSRRVKTGFDPQGVLNPGRMQEGV